MIREFVCEKCGKPFEKAWFPCRNIPKFCSPECGKRRKRIKCKVCQEYFETYLSRKNSQFCSVKCATMAQRREPKICQFCGKEFTNTNDKYCTYECCVSHRRSLVLKKTCNHCGKVFNSQKSLWHRPYCSPKCSQEAIRASGILAKENSPNWKGGFVSYRGPNWQAQRSKARNRDNHTCQVCGYQSLKPKLPVHHIKPFREFGIENYKLANELSNLITLCSPCHAKADRGILLLPASTGLPLTPRNARGQWINSP